MRSNKINKNTYNQWKGKSWIYSGCVTEPDKELWLDSIKQLSALLSRRAAYAKAYNIEEKIRIAKRNGWWPPKLAI